MNAPPERSRSALKQARATTLALTAAALLGGGCENLGFDCWTQERYRAAASNQGGSIGEIQAGTTRGEVVTENPANWWTNARFTGNPCQIQVEHRPDGTYVQADFLDAAVKLHARMGPADSPFFAGETGDGKAVVLQHRLGRPVSLTLMRYEDDGVLSYGGCGQRETPYLECHHNPE